MRELELRNQAFSGRDGDVGVGRDAGHFIHVFRRHGLFEPGSLMIFPNGNNMRSRSIDTTAAKDRPRVR